MKSVINMDLTLNKPFSLDVKTLIQVLVYMLAHMIHTMLSLNYSIK
jgi:hypothetical protein